MKQNLFYFSHARTALKYGLQNLNLKDGECILIPEYICDVVLHPLENLGIKFKFYPINDDFAPKWDILEGMINDRVKGLLMVHYFGQPQEIEKFQSFCNKHGLFLIEDNAHGYGGRYKGSKLGTFGDFGISSPRKILKIHSGGVLWLKENKLDNDISLIPFSPSIISYLNVFMDNNYPSLKFLLKKLLKNRPDYEDYKLFREDKINDYMIDFSSKRILKKVKLKRIIKHRQDIYNKWHLFALKNNLTPVFSKIYPNANPWCFPAYVRNHKEAIKWFDWGWENNEHIFSWPSLPEEGIHSNNKLLERWEKLICFGIK